MVSTKDSAKPQNIGKGNSRNKEASLITYFHNSVNASFAEILIYFVFNTIQIMASPAVLLH